MSKTQQGIPLETVLGLPLFSQNTSFGPFSEKATPPPPLPPPGLCLRSFSVGSKPKLQALDAMEVDQFQETREELKWAKPKANS